MLNALSIPDAYAYARLTPNDAMLATAFFFVTSQGNVVVDPLPLDDATRGEIDRRGGISVVVVMTADRETAAQSTAAQYGATIVNAPRHGDAIAPGLFAVRLLDQRREHQFAVNLPDHRAVIVGDALFGDPAGALSMPAHADYLDPLKAALGLRRILRENPEMLLLTHGHSLYAGAYDVLYRTLHEKAGAELLRINLDALDFRDGRDEHDEQPSQYVCLDAEVGFAIGARKLGYRVTTLEPGHRFCPLHGHAREEELFYVIDGAPSVRTLAGTIRCRQGDFIALPVGETGTHQLLNESDAPATVLLLARNEEVEACYYPDSDKLLVDTPMPFAGGRTSILVKGSPDLDYFDGETS